MFDKIKDMYKMQQQAKQMRSALSKTHIKASSEGVTVTITAEMELVSVDIADDAMMLPKERLGKAITEAFNKAKKKAEQIAAEYMKSIMKDGIPGLPQS